MIKQIYLKNFQSHKETTIDLVDGVNVILGIGQSGKTAILRGEELIRTNRPLGFKYHSNFAEEPETIIRITYTDNVVEFIKTKSGAVYELNGDKLEFVGNNVPDVIKDAINMDDINIASQLETPFLICDTPGQVAKTFNQITSIDEADKWNSKIKSKINDLSKEIKILDKDIESKDTKIKSYSYIEEAEGRIKILEVLDKELEVTESKIEKLSSWLERYKTVKIEFDEVSKIVKSCEGIVSNIDNNLDRLDIVNNEINLLEDYAEKKSKLEKYNYVDSCDDIVDNIKIGLEELKTIDQNIEKLDSYLDQVEVKKLEIMSLENNIHHLSEQYIDILKEEKKCPTCNSEITEVLIKEIQESLI